MRYKFRAWLKQEKKMVEVEEIDFIGQKQIAYDEIEYRYTDKEPFHYTQWVDFDEIKLMQTTGLKDKNGVDIYEGDIVDDLGTRYTVIWEQFDCSFQLSCSRYQCSLGEYDTNTIEVIGNIYENKELLENE